jgi:hypothetical protein
MKDETKKNGTDDKSRERKKIKLLYTAIIFLSIIGLAIVYILVPIDPGAKFPKTFQMKKMAVKIGELEAEVKKKQDELISLLNIYNQQTAEPPPALNQLGLSDEEKKILEDKIINEKNVSIKSLLKDILDRDNEISDLKDKMKNYEALLPKPRIAREGETHYEIAMDFLIKEKKVEKEKANRLVDETILFDPLKPGFRVWNFYSGDEYVTFVTQGSATISPAELRKTPEKSRDDTGNSNIDEKKKLDAEINRLKLTKNQLESKIRNLRKEKQRMEKKLNDLNKQNSEKERLLNSLFYMVDLEENLLKRGIIKSGFLGLGSPKLKKISLNDYDQSIDLREKKIIEIYASQFNLSKIKKVTLHPKFYKRDVDYKVKFEEDNRKAVLEILTIEKFKNERVVISIE